jgi:hypothetical protein
MDGRGPHLEPANTVSVPVFQFEDFPIRVDILADRGAQTPNCQF